MTSAPLAGHQALRPRSATTAPRPRFARRIGGGAKPPSPVEVINDIDGEVTHCFTVLRTDADRLARACKLTPYSRAEYESCAGRAIDLDPSRPTGSSVRA